jgi:hypothetical protein
MYCNIYSRCTRVMLKEGGGFGAMNNCVVAFWIQARFRPKHVCYYCFNYYRLFVTYVTVRLTV